MNAADVMATNVVTLRPEMTTQEAAKVLLERGVSGAPVVDAAGRLVGIISEGDLIRRAEIGTEPRRRWFLEIFTSPATLQQEFIKAHALKVDDVMTRRAVTASEETPLRDIATLIEKRGIKRVPVVRGDRVVGIVSRANLLRAFASTTTPAATSDDKAIRTHILDQVAKLGASHLWQLSVTVQDGAVELWGAVESALAKRAIRVAAESTPGVKSVTDNLYEFPIRYAA
jgi:CBS domain-containing protein